MKVEVNMVVSSVSEACEYYTKLFGAKLLSKTENKKELNEAIFKLASVEIRMLNENEDYGLFAPKESESNSMWLNLIVDDIDSFFQNSLSLGVEVIYPVTEFPEINVKNCVILDKFNHTWVINQNYDN